MLGLNEVVAAQPQNRPRYLFLQASRCAMDASGLAMGSALQRGSKTSRNQIRLPVRISPVRPEKRKTHQILALV